MAQVRSLLAEAQALSTRLAALNEIAVSVQEELDADKLMQAVARHSRWVIDFQLCSVAWLQPEGYTIQVLRGAVDAAPAALYPRDFGAIGRVLTRHHAVLVSAAAEADQLPPELLSAMVVPLRSGGELLGTLNFYSTTLNQYKLDDLRVATALAMNVAALLQNIRLFSEVARARNEIVTTLDSISEAVLVIDRAGRIRIINQHAARLLKLNLARTLGQPIEELVQLERGSAPSAVVLGLRAQIMTIWQQAAQQTRGQITVTEGQHLEWTVASLVASSEFDGVVLTLRDISDSVALEALRDDFIHMLVHDLRTPLTSIMLAFDMIQAASADQDQATVSEMVTVARGSANRLLGQISMLLDVRKIEAGQLVLSREPTDLILLIERACVTVQPIAQGQRQTLSLHPPPESLVALIDPLLIQRVFENLLGNALKFSPDGSQVTVSLQCSSDTIECAVSDEGPGVPAAVRAIIFEKYRQAEAQPRQHSTGLGLAFCKLVMEQHGGTIGVDPIATGGSRFWVRFPR